MKKAVLKYHNHDFLVIESLVLNRAINPRHAGFSYFRLLKSGFTTFEAITKISDYLCIKPDLISYAGLKDEDAITEQSISINSSVLNKPKQSFSDFNERNRFSSNNFISLDYSGCGHEEIRIGKLNGNSFLIVVRNLSASLADRLLNLGEFNRNTFYFLNYYDTQRFGVTNSPKVSHLIGKALIECDEELAFSYVKKAELPESLTANNFKGLGTEFFSELEIRKVNFFKSAYESYIWNNKLSQIVQDTYPSDAYEYHFDNHTFLLVDNKKSLIDILSKCHQLDYIRYYDNKSVGFRPTVIQTQVICSKIEKDEIHPDRFKCSFSFFLPSGCYATMCTKQIIDQISRTQERPI